MRKLWGCLKFWHPTLGENVNHITITWQKMIFLMSQWLTLSSHQYSLGLISSVSKWDGCWSPDQSGRWVFHLVLQTCHCKTTVTPWERKRSFFSLCKNNFKLKLFKQKWRFFSSKLIFHVTLGGLWGVDGTTFLTLINKTFLMLLHSTFYLNEINISAKFSYKISSLDWSDDWT